MIGEIPENRRLNINKNEFQGNLYEGAANSECVIQTLDELSKNIERTSIIILDNASIHKAKIVQEKMKEWRMIAATQIF